MLTYAFWRDPESGHTCLVRMSADGQWYGISFDVPDYYVRSLRTVRMNKRVALWQLKNPHMSADWPIVRSIGMESLRCYINACAEKAKAHPVHVLIPWHEAHWI